MENVAFFVKSIISYYKLLGVECIFIIFHYNIYLSDFSIVN